MIFKISLISKRDIRPSSCTLGYSTCGWLRGWSVFFPPSPKTVTSVIMVMLLTFVVSKTMSVTVIDSNSSCYQNKITNCSGNHEASEVPKLLPIKRLWVVFQNVHMKLSAWSRSPPLLPLIPLPPYSPSNQPSHAGRGLAEDPAAPASLLPQLPRNSPCSGVSLLCWPCGWVTHRKGHNVRTLEFSDLMCPCPYQWGGQGEGREEVGKVDHENTQDKGLLRWQRII